MFSLIFTNMQIIFVYQTTMLKYYMTQLSFGTNFGSLELSTADKWVMLYVHPFKFSIIFILFLMFSILFMDMQIR